MRCVLISMWFVRCKLCRVHCPTLTSTHYHRWTPLFSHWETPWNTAWQQQKKDWPPFQSSKEIKIFSRFRLVKTTRIIHHNQLLFTKFGKNLRHIKSMTSKVQPAENYWTNDVKMTSKVQPAVDYWTTSLHFTSLHFTGKRKNKERNGETHLRTRKYFEGILKQLLNSAFVGYEEFCRSRSVIHLGLRPLWITLSLICRILHILRKANSINALFFIQNISPFLKEFHHYALCFSAHQI